MLDVFSSQSDHECLHRAAFRGDHVGDSPEAVAKLMIHLGKRASPGPAWYRVREVIAALLGNERLAADLRKPLLELAARLGPV